MHNLGEATMQIDDEFRQQMLDAVRDEVSAAFPSAEQIVEAIRDGVRAAMWQMITNATDMPCADFYDTIEKAVRQAAEDVLSRKGTE